MKFRIDDRMKTLLRVAEEDNIEPNRKSYKALRDYLDESSYLVTMNEDGEFRLTLKFPDKNITMKFHKNGLRSEIHLEHDDFVEENIKPILMNSSAFEEIRKECYFRGWGEYGDEPAITSKQVSFAEFVTSYVMGYYKFDGYDPAPGGDGTIGIEFYNDKVLFWIDVYSDHTVIYNTESKKELKLLNDDPKFISKLVQFMGENNENSNI